jgi:hypothetical protein
MQNEDKVELTYYIGLDAQWLVVKAPPPPQERPSQPHHPNATSC